ncbi:MAG: PilZ domain-containing protein [Syntrophobacterales bacterium]|nr:MAG: PilZ domain-containing protein [Syntrophobacterales bacterium]
MNLIERRSHPRIGIYHPVYYFTDHGSNPKLGSAIDLSMGGIRIKTPYSVIEGQELEIFIVIDTQVIKTKGKVVSVSRSKGKNLTARIRFAEISNPDGPYLEQYLSSVMERHKAWEK